MRQALLAKKISWYYKLFASWYGDANKALDKLTKAMETMNLELAVDTEESRASAGPNSVPLHDLSAYPPGVLEYLLHVWATQPTLLSGPACPVSQPGARKRSLMRCLLFQRAALCVQRTHGERRLLCCYVR